MPCLLTLHHGANLTFTVQLPMMSALSWFATICLGVVSRMGRLGLRNTL